MKTTIRKTCFLSGKVSGLPRWWVVVKFAVVAWWLEQQGYTVYNPAKEIPAGTPWSIAMDICLEQLRKSNFVYFMHDWRRSNVAKIEFIAAADYGLLLLNSSLKLHREFVETIQRRRYTGKKVAI